MSKTKAGMTAGAVLLSAALAVILFNSWLTAQSYEKATELASSSQAPTPAASQSDQVWTYNCELPLQRPEEILLRCADGGWLLTNINWTTWSPKGATGSGIYSVNPCVPSCAEAQRVEAPVTLTLSNLTKKNGKYYLRSLDITTTNGKDFPWGRANSLKWDVMEFAEMMVSP